MWYLVSAKNKYQGPVSTLEEDVVTATRKGRKDMDVDRHRREGSEFGAGILGLIAVLAIILAIVS